MKPPFSKNTPLSQFPYNSRTGDNEFDMYVPSKNYILHGFKPGNALQASELNEIQENFYKNLTLHNILLKNWIFIGSSLFQPAIPTEPIRGPSWFGAVPLHPFQSVSYINGVVSIKPDWYLVDDFSGIKFWIYNNTVKNIPISSVSNNLTIVLDITSGYVNGNQDTNLKDNSNGYLNSSLSLGADRYKFDINGVKITSNPLSNQREILKITNGKLSYINNLLFATI